MGKMDIQIVKSMFLKCLERYGPPPIEGTMHRSIKYPKYQKGCLGELCILPQTGQPKTVQIIQSLGMRAKPEGGKSSLSYSNASVVILSHMWVGGCGREDRAIERGREKQGMLI